MSNGLRVIIHEDPGTPMVAVNVVYDVGSKDEDSERTGFAHLFEHLMFGGSVNIASYDEPLQQVGAQNNAFTSTDITNYYITLPKDNIETALWLESDRMLDLAFSEKSLEVQRKVVIEEFKQRYLNQPYGEVWLELRPLTYEVSPYRWATIGKEVGHIEEATMEDVKAFFRKHYNPENAVLVVAGGIETQPTLELVEKWFGSIPKGEKYVRNLVKEPEQLAPRTKTVYKDVPQDALYMAWPMAGKYTPEYYAADIISDALSRGNSSRFYQEILQKTDVFSQLDAYVTGEYESGLFIISGRLLHGKTTAEGEAIINEALQKFITGGFYPRELDKIKNKVESSLLFQDTQVLNKAMGLAFFELQGDAGAINNELANYRSVSEAFAIETAQRIFQPQRLNTMYYLSQQLHS
ncbi:MAG: pitrilysin family protein [Bacteroidota bacterium]